MIYKHYLKFFIWLMLLFGAIYLVLKGAPPNRTNFTEINKLVYFLNSYSEDRQNLYGFFPDQHSWNEIIISHPEFEQFIYRSDLNKYLNENGKFTNIVAWKFYGEIIRYIDSVPSFYEKTHSFNINKGELPIFFQVKSKKAHENYDYVFNFFQGDEDFLIKHSGQTPLLLQLIFGNITSEHIQFSPFVNQPDGNNITPLMRAVSLNRTDLVHALINRNVDENIKNIWGMTALDIAKLKNNKEIISLLDKND